MRAHGLTPTAFEQIDLFGDPIDVVVAGDGCGYASVRRMCESIGIDHLTQPAKLNGCHWARKVIITLPDSSGHYQGVYALRIEDVAAWLMTIRPAKVALG